MGRSFASDDIRTYLRGTRPQRHRRNDREGLQRTEGMRQDLRRVLHLERTEGMRQDLRRVLHLDAHRHQGRGPGGRPGQEDSCPLPRPGRGVRRRHQGRHGDEGRLHNGRRHDVRHHTRGPQDPGCRGGDPRQDVPRDFDLLRMSHIARPSTGFRSSPHVPHRSACSTTSSAGQSRSRSSRRTTTPSPPTTTSRRTRTGVSTR